MSQRKYFVPILDNGGGSVKANYVMSLLCALGGINIQVSRASDSLASRGMNRVTADFLASDCTHLLVIDCDIIFTRGHIDLITSHDVPLVYGIYPKRQPKLELCLCTLDDHKEDPGAILVPIKRAGRGFTLAAREVFEKMRDNPPAKYPVAKYTNHGREEWNFWHADVVDSEYLSEDWYFCDRWRAMGETVYVDQRVQLGHEGDCIFPIMPETQKSDWRAIQGWFSEADADFYKWLAATIPIGAKFCEVGAWRGRSTAAFSEFSRGKSIEHHVVDTFNGSPDETIHAQIIAGLKGTLQEDFDYNMKALGVSAIVHAKPSLEAAGEFADGSLDAVFIDAAHDFDSALADIRAWLPKVKAGGIISGHDADYDDIKRALSVTVGLWKTGGRCWYAIK